MTRSTTATVILYVGGFIILYSILRSWGIIQPTPTSTPTHSLSSWRPLSNQELESLKYKYY